MTEAKTHLSWIDDETDHDDGGEGLMTLAPSIALLNADGSRDHWNGVGRINSRSGSNCTATLINSRSVDSPPDAPAAG
ncbi:hypothetical protein AO388_05250 [Pseudomonas sp. ICMP 10191]|nr:hypothetical protein AO388_05250 [Pseudomonas sp. ICMP 10191]RMS22246.1 Peptidase S1, chymotrypsin [Pseudomonas syringae pv. aceris]